MANTYSWKINTLDTKIKHEEKDNVIYCVHWVYLAKDDSEIPYIASNYGAESFEYNKDSFKEFTDIKKEDVVGWLESKLDVDSLKQKLDKEIELQKNPTENSINPEWE